MTTLPPGWKRFINNRGRIQYSSPPPITQIRSKSELLRHQSQGRYQELDANSVTFLVKKTKSKKNHVILQHSAVVQSVQPDPEPHTDKPLDISEHVQANLGIADEILSQSPLVPVALEVLSPSSSISEAPLPTLDTSSRKRMKAVG